MIIIRTIATKRTRNVEPTMIVFRCDTFIGVIPLSVIIGNRIDTSYLLVFEKTISLEIFQKIINL